MSGVQIFCGVQMPTLLTPEELEDMLDFSDIGGVYDSVGAAAANTLALQNFLDLRVNQPGIQIAFTGNRLSQTYNNKRQPGTAYFDLSGGPITYTAGSTHNGDLLFLGYPGSVIAGTSPQTALTPIFEFTRNNGGMQAYQFHNLEFQNGLGSGIKFTADPSGPGSRCIFNQCYWHYIGTSIGTPPAIDFDGWTDLDTAVYGLWFESADGLHLYSCNMQGVAGHGLITKRWHEGVCHLQARECSGTALKGRQLNGLALNLRAESNGGYGLHVQDTGNNRYIDGAAQADGNGAPEAWEVWFEANNGRGGSSSGYQYRQMKVDGSSRLTIGGHSGWSGGKVAVAEPSRRSCRFIEEDYIDPSTDGNYCILAYDMNNDGSDITNQNWSTVWPNAGDRAYITEFGDDTAGTYEVTITIPTGAYDAATTSAYWIPTSIIPMPSSAVGDMWMYTMEISTNAGGVSYCEDRDALPVSTRMSSHLGSIDIRPVSGALNGISLWSTARRKFSGRVAMDYVTSSMGLTLYVKASGMEDTGGSGILYPQDEIVLSIHSLKLYRMKE